MDRSDVDDDLEEVDSNTEVEKEVKAEEAPVGSSRLSQLDFYQANPFAHCQGDRTYLFYHLHSVSCFTFMT